MADSFPIKFTKMAEAFARAKWSLPAVEERVRKEVDEFLVDCEGGMNDLFMHTVFMERIPEDGIKDETFFICFPRDGILVVDIGLYDEGEVLKSGPFAGKRVMLPRPASEDDR